MILLKLTMGWSGEPGYIVADKIIGIYSADVEHEPAEDGLVGATAPGALIDLLGGSVAAGQADTDCNYEHVRETPEQVVAMLWRALTEKRGRVDPELVVISHGTVEAHAKDGRELRRDQEAFAQAAHRVLYYTGTPDDPPPIHGDQEYQRRVLHLRLMVARVLAADAETDAEPTP